jgi:MFS family permease
VVPDDHKGLLGGLMAFAPGLGALAGALVTIPGLADGQMRLGLVASLIALCVVPVLLHGAPRSLPAQAQAQSEPRRKQGLALRMWLARLAVQVAEATLFAYLFFWLVSLDGSVSDNQTARLFSVILLVYAPLALLVGRWSDRTDRPIMPLQACALISALGLVGMALAPDITGAMLAYGLFGVSSAVFLALHSAQTLRILPRPDRRGRDLGLFNLANTVPSLVMPWLTMAIVPAAGYPALFVLLAGLAALFQATAGGTAYTTETLRRSAVAQAPTPVPDFRVVDAEGREQTLRSLLANAATNGTGSAPDSSAFRNDTSASPGRPAIAMSATRKAVASARPP